MTEPAIRELLSAAHRCAMVMLENATYIQGELPNVHLDGSLRARVNEACDSLIGTKHDIVSEVSELDELLAGDAASPATIATRVERIVRWLREDVTRMHELALALEVAKEGDPACTGAYVLVVESAANILQAFNQVAAAAADVVAGEQGGPPDA
jgi:hypothetical protein